MEEKQLPGCSSVSQSYNCITITTHRQLLWRHYSGNSQLKQIQVCSPETFSHTPEAAGKMILCMWEVWRQQWQWHPLGLPSVPWAGRTQWQTHLPTTHSSNLIISYAVSYDHGLFWASFFHVHQFNVLLFTFLTCLFSLGFILLIFFYTSTSQFCTVWVEMGPYYLSWKLINGQITNSWNEKTKAELISWVTETCW